MEIITTELRARFPMELLYADDFVLMAASAKRKIQWKSGLEAKGLKVNAGKMKIMFSCSIKDKVEKS